MYSNCSSAAVGQRRALELATVGTASASGSV